MNRLKRYRDFLPKNNKMELLKLSLFIFFIQCILFVIFVAFGVYTAKADASNMGNSISPVFGGFNHERFNNVSRFQPMFEGIHVMIFIGFGFLMVFLKKYGYSSVGFNFLLAAIIIQWSILCQGFFELNDEYKIEVGLTSLYRADIASATALISMGAVLGRTCHTQLVVMGILEILAYAINNALNAKYIKAVDVGGSILVHAFGAYFGLAVSYVLRKKQKNFDLEVGIESVQESSYVSNIFAMIGTLFLWVYWPSFNAVDLENDMAHRAIINTYLSLAASCVIAFAISQMTSGDHKFNMVHIQNSTLAGGVAIGASANLMVQPFGAILIGMTAGGLSVYGFKTISRFLEHRLRIQDCCGVHNLHGIPGILGGVIAIIMSGIATEQQYGKTLYEVYPAMASPVISQNIEYIPLEPGDGRTAGQQAGYQALLLLVTMVVAAICGFISGLIINLGIWNSISPENFYDDSLFWEMPSSIIEDNDDNNFKEKKWRFVGKLHNSSIYNIPTISL